MLFSIPLVPYNIMAGFSGISFIEDYYFALYEVILTTWAILFYLAFEVDVDPRFKSMNFGGDFLAKRYRHAREADFKSLWTKFGIWIAYAWFSGLTFFCFGFISYHLTSVNSDGKVDGLSASGFTSFSSLLCVHHLILFIGTRGWTWILILGYVLSIICFMPLTVWLNDSSAGTYAY